MKTELISSIPSDRAYLQFEAVRLGPEKIQVDYELVIPLTETDCRGTWDHKASKRRPISHIRIWLDSDNCRHFPIGRTIIETSNPDYPFHTATPQEIGLPFRDGAHAHWDNEKLGGLELYYRSGNFIYRLIPEPRHLIF